MQSNRYHAMGAFCLSLLLMFLVLPGTSTEALAQDRTAFWETYDQLTFDLDMAKMSYRRDATPTAKVTVERALQAFEDFSEANQAAIKEALAIRKARLTLASAGHGFRTASDHTFHYDVDCGSVPIPDGDPTGADCTIEVTGSGTIGDLDVEVEILHTWIDDLVIDVTSPAGTNVLLNDNTCGNFDDFSATFDDEGAPLVCPPVGLAPTIPDEPLGAFDGESITGTWTLHVEDNVFFDAGTIELFGLWGEFAITDLELEKECDADDDGTGSYHLTLTNTSDTDATGVVVTDWLLDAIDDVDGRTSSGTFNDGTGVWTVGDLAAGSSASLWIDFTFDVGVPGLYLNHAEVTSAAPDDTDSTPGDGMGDDYAECGFVVLADRSVPDFVPENARGNADRGRVFNADLEVNKAVDVETASVGSMVHYTVTVGNNGPHSTTKVQVTDHLPDCLVDPTWETTRGTYDGWFWDISAIKVGETLTLEVWATVGDTCDGTVTNKAWVSKSALPDPSVSPLDPDAPVENPFDERETLRNNHDEASFDVDTGSGRALEGTVFALGRNYPNPFNPTTVVPFSLAEASQVSIKVYDLLGREMAVLVDGAMSAGVHEVTFEASALPTGVYLIRMEAAGTVHIQRVTLMK